MPKTERVTQLEKEIADVRYQLIIKGSQLRFLKDNEERIVPLTNEVRKLREQLHQLNGTNSCVNNALIKVTYLLDTNH